MYLDFGNCIIVLSILGLWPTENPRLQVSLTFCTVTADFIRSNFSITSIYLYCHFVIKIILVH